MTYRPFHNLAEGGNRKITPRGPLRPVRRGTDRSRCPGNNRAEVMPRNKEYVYFCVRAGVSRTWVVDVRTTRARLTRSDSFGRRGDSKVRVEVFSPRVSVSRSPVIPTPVSKS